MVRPYDGLFKQLKKALIERALGAELTEHLGYETGDPAGRGRGNSRDGTSSKTVLTEDGEVEIAVPRDRGGTFEPQLIVKGQAHFDGCSRSPERLACARRSTSLRRHLARRLGAAPLRGPFFLFSQPT
jgi:transposase-like protein